MLIMSIVNWFDFVVRSRFICLVNQCNCLHKRSTHTVFECSTMKSRIRTVNRLHEVPLTLRHDLDWLLSHWIHSLFWFGFSIFITILDLVPQRDSDIHSHRQEIFYSPFVPNIQRKHGPNENKTQECTSDTLRCVGVGAFFWSPLSAFLANLCKMIIFPTCMRQ